MSTKVDVRLKAKYKSTIAPALKAEFGFKNPMMVPTLTKVIVNMGVGDAARDSKLIEGAIRDLVTITGQKPQVTKARKSIAQFKLREGQPIGAHVTLRGDRMWEFADRLLSISLPRIRDFRGLSPKQFDGRGNYTFGLTEQVVFPVTKARKSIAQFKLREGQPIGAHVTLRGDRMWEFADRLLSISLPRIRDFRGLSPKQFDGRGNYTFGLTEQVVFPEIEQDKVDRPRGMDITFVTTAKNDDEGRALLKALGFPFKEA